MIRSAIWTTARATLFRVADNFYIGPMASYDYMPSLLQPYQLLIFDFLSVYSFF